MINEETQEEVKQGVEQAIEEAVAPKAASAKPFTILWEMAGWSLVGFDDGEIGIASADFLRMHPKSGWTSNTHRRMRAEDGATVIYLRKPDAPPPTIGSKSARELISKEQARSELSGMEKYLAYEAITFKLADVFTDAHYQVMLGYSVLSKVWVVSAPPQRQVGKGIWGLGLSFAPYVPPEPEPVYPEMDDAEREGLDHDSGEQPELTLPYQDNDE